MAGARTAYGTHPDQHADLWLPAGAGPWPAVVVVHGGFWRDRYGADLSEGIARDLVARGLAVWNVEYRRLGSGGGWPATGDDVEAALDALAEHADAVDLARVAAVGHSAGGHLALWLASRPPRRVALRAVVAQAPVADLAEAARRGLSSGVTVELLGGTPDEVPERYAAASPAELLPLGVPLTVVYGEEDDAVPPDLIAAFCEAARAAGDQVDEVVVPDSDHMDHVAPASDCWQAAAAALERALR